MFASLCFSALGNSRAKVMGTSAHRPQIPAIGSSQIRFFRRGMRSAVQTPTEAFLFCSRVDVPFKSGPRRSRPSFSDKPPGATQHRTENPLKSAPIGFRLAGPRRGPSPGVAPRSPLQRNAGTIRNDTGIPVPALCFDGHLTLKPWSQGEAYGILFEKTAKCTVRDQRTISRSTQRERERGGGQKEREVDRKIDKQTDI